MNRKSNITLTRWICQRLTLTYVKQKKKIKLFVSCIKFNELFKWSQSVSITSVSYNSIAFTKRIRTLAAHSKLLVPVNTPQRSRHSPHYCRVGNNPQLKGSLKFNCDLKAYWNCIKTLKYSVLVINFFKVRKIILILNT